jgi:hypothetical protein
MRRTPDTGEAADANDAFSLAKWLAECRVHLDAVPGTPNSGSAKFAGNCLFVPIRRSALRFPRCCVGAVSTCTNIHAAFFFFSPGDQVA